MRCKVLVTIWFLTLAFGSFAFTVGREQASEANKKPEKTSAEEFRRWIADLGSEDAGTRNTAAARLRENPDSRHLLRRQKPADPTTRERIEEIIRYHARREFKKQLASLAKQGDEAPIDLLVELLTEHRYDVGDAEWKTAMGVVTAIAKRISKGTKINDIPHPKFNVQSLDSIVGEQVALKDTDAGFPRVIADRLTIGMRMRRCAGVTADEIDLRDMCGWGVYMTNGTFRMDANAGNRDDRRIWASFVYCDKDFFGCYVGDCIVVTRGRIRIDRQRQEDCLYLENARSSKVVSLFRSESVGIIGEEANRELRVKAVSPASVAAKAGLVASDVILLKMGSNDLLSDLDRAVRRALVKEAELVLTIRRNGLERKITVSFAE